MKKKDTDILLSLNTPFAEDGDLNREEYPRPQMKRNSYFPLSGEWELSVCRGEDITELGKIRVPFPPESALSGISRTTERGEMWLYRHHFTLPDGFCRGRVLLHFGAVDQIAHVSLNGHCFPEHVGGYLPFSFDITEYLRPGDNTLCVRVQDELDTDIPYGKQRRDRGGMWYTPISGIWQPVWIESVPENAITALRITPDLNGITLETRGGQAEKTVILGDQTVRYTGDRVRIDVDMPIHWTPERPHLYFFTLTDGVDRIESYFALRTVTVVQHGNTPLICLNGQPYFFHGVLDQGYYSDGIYTPASPRALQYDIQKMKELGFNMLRKHIKIEPQLYYYYCDKYGMIVFQDMVNSGKYSFLRDTALPTAGIKRGIRVRASKRRKKLFESAMRETAVFLYNHPCVCYYTIFNEGWGQYEADRLYREMKKIDPSRIYDSTSGWFWERESDVRSEHIYFRKIRLKKDSRRPLVLSEFGGYSCKTEGHMANPAKSYGYRSMPSHERFEQALLSLYREQVIPMIGRGLNAAVLTQLSDVEDEINGLLTYDRHVCKVKSQSMRELAKELFCAFADACMRANNA